MKEKNNMSVEKIKQSVPLRRLLIGIAFALIVLILAGITFSFVSKFVSGWEMTSLPGLAVNKNPTQISETSSMPGDLTPTQMPAKAVLPTPQPWDGATRVTILVMGLDYRDWAAGEGPSRTDTMILLTIDPLTKTGGLLTIPRDLWVSIPGYGYGKINTAYQIGEGARLPGGGPALAIKTVEGLLGVPITYYAQIDFSAFERFIDEIGGVKLDIPKKIKIDLIGDEKGKVLLKAGVQTLPGNYALAYSRARNTEGGDFDRAKRQQQVILAVRDRVLSFNLIPVLLQKALPLYNELSGGINTNLSMDEAFRLAWLAQQIPEENIKHGIIGPEQVAFGKSPDGLDILKPLPDKIRILRDEIFTTSGPLSPLAKDDKAPEDLMVSEGAKISVLNGTVTPGIAGRTSEYFKGLGADVVYVADAENKPYPYTAIYDYTGNPYTVQYFVDLMNISRYRVFQRFAPESEIDVAIILGNDWVGNNPMP
ncbi:MAG: LCP family protein [Anaerolineales bacterium]|nr:LCP family protein [Anaerolineales bacterium]